ncbi:DUF6398 domain-containing protein [Nostoc sp. ChiQUE01b]|uniref:DUF6398 domain-containing protein n=1 Tax=Nostoc sp. ChiQUE01b TaxID=3075376 RepID=UPI002AD3144B|nr:DUF6398 domain-containing protein [Nostoc sp. ChiQUE01b]MDZ8257440.1 DUF6398 domain-containing protein [Nostoc sp. ChiQUE01b]
MLSTSQRRICRDVAPVGGCSCRKRPSPLATGQAKSWACGIVHALGMVNFLYDSSQTPPKTMKKCGSTKL